MMDASEDDLECDLDDFDGLDDDEGMVVQGNDMRIVEG